MTTNPGTYDITIHQGATFGLVLTWKDDTEEEVDLTGFSARLQMRESIDAEEPFLTLTTENGGITLGGATGTITLSSAASDTAALAVTSGVYDLELISGSGIITRLLQGSVLISREVTR